MAINTSNTILKSSATEVGAFTKLLDIVSYPDLGSAPSTLDSTTLTNAQIKTSILGLQEAPDLTFEGLYTLAEYTSLKALEGDLLWFNLELGDTGEDGIFVWSGKISVYTNAGAVDEIRKMTVVTSAETEIKLKA